MENGKNKGARAMEMANGKFRMADEMSAGPNSSDPGVE